MTVLEEHLGGHNDRTHTDEGLLSWAKTNLNVKTMIDIGCGPGGQVELANKMGIVAKGVDGDYTIDRYDDSKFLIHDFTKGPTDINETFDLAWSVEFVEHVYEKYIPNYVDLMQKAKYLIMTYAPVGHQGHHHVNCNTQDYWIDTMSKYGFVYDRNLTNTIRQHSTMGSKRKHQFIKNTGLFFTNEQK